MSLYNPNSRPNRSPCAPNEANCSQPDCGPFPGNDLACCPTTFPSHSACPVEVYVPGCEPSLDRPLTGGVNCDCIPCPEVAFTAEQKAVVSQMLQGLLKNISPYAFSCCEIIDPIGHHTPLANRLADAQYGGKIFDGPTDPTTNGFQTYVTDVVAPTMRQEFQVFEFEDALTSLASDANAVISADSLRQRAIEQNGFEVGVDGTNGVGERLTELMRNAPAGDDYGFRFEECCDIPKEAGFVNYGLSPMGAMGIVPMHITPIGDLTSIEGHDDLGHLFCCTLDKLFNAPEMVIEEDQ